MDQSAPTCVSLKGGSSPIAGGRVAELGQRAQKFRTIPAALNAMAESIELQRAADAALARGDRDIAASLLAECIRAAELFDAMYNVPLEPALAMVLPVDPRRSRSTGGNLPDARAVGRRALGRAIVERLGYRDGLAGQVPVAPTCSVATKWLGGGWVCRWGRCAYYRGFAYAAAERELLSCAPSLVAAVDERVDILERWSHRWRAGTRWVLRSDVRRRLTAGARVRRAVDYVTRSQDELDEAILRRRVALYAAGRARLIQQHAARRLVDVAIANTAADPRVGAAALYDALIRGVTRSTASNARSSTPRHAKRRHALELQLIEVALDLLVVGDGQTRRFRWASTSELDALDIGQAVSQLLVALNRCPGVRAGYAGGRAISKLGAIAGEFAERLSRRRAANPIGDAAARRVAEAECALVHRGSRSTAIVAEGWLRAYRDEANRLPDGSTDRALLVGRITALNASIADKAMREASGLFHAWLACALAGATPSSQSGGRRAAVESALNRAQKSFDIAGGKLAADHITVDVNAWFDRVTHAMEREAALWQEVEEMRLHRVTWRERLDLWWNETREAGRTVWRWLGRSVDVGLPDQVVSLRLVRFRILALEILFFVPPAIVLSSGTNEIAVIGSAGVLVVVYLASLLRLGSLEDPHWWRVGICTLGLVPFGAAMVHVTPDHVSRVNDAFIMWEIATPFALPAARWLTGKIAAKEIRRRMQLLQRFTGSGGISRSAGRALQLHAIESDRL